MSGEQRNPWDGVSYSIRLYDYDRGEYRDVDVGEVPQEMINRWLMWRIGDLQRVVEETRGLMQLANKACNGHASEEGRLRERIREAAGILSATLLDDGVRGDVHVYVISNRDAERVFNLLHLEEKKT